MIRDRLFLDANVLFSTAWRDDTGLLCFWRPGFAELVTSDLAVDEARRNLFVHRSDRLDAFDRLLDAVVVFRSPFPRSVETTDARLDAKDAPLLDAALHVNAACFITGDRRHFGHLFGTHVRNTIILTPSLYVAGREESS